MYIIILLECIVFGKYVVDVVVFFVYDYVFGFCNYCIINVI